MPEPLFPASTRQPARYVEVGERLTDEEVDLGSELDRRVGVALGDARESVGARMNGLSCRGEERTMKLTSSTCSITPDLATV